MKFNVGDRVRRIAYDKPWEGIVGGYSKSGKNICIHSITDANVAGWQDYEGGWHPQNFELVAPSGPEEYEEWFK